MKNIAVCLTPELIHLFDLKGKTVVVVDILRATSCMVSGFANGIEKIKPVASLEECKELGKNGYLTAAERGGQKVEGFDMGNSPFSYMDPAIKGKKVAVTTTNGTLAISKSIGAEHILIGSFLNISRVAEEVRKLDKDVIIHCAGWKGAVNLEDTLFAGALIELVQDAFEITSDDARMAFGLFAQHKNDLFKIVSNSAHAKRLEKFGVIKDIEICVKRDEFDILPYLASDELRA